MRVSTQEICRFADTNPRAKSFRGGEDLLNADFIIQCGQVENNSSDCESYKILAFCLQTSQLKSNPHEITGEILKDGRIIGMECSCKAGLSGVCKHVVAVLLYCSRNDLESLKTITCTDKKCVWNAPHASSLAKYEPRPFNEHECMFKRREKDLQAQNRRKTRVDNEPNVVEGGKSELSTSQEDLLRTIMARKLPKSALPLHMCGRHETFEAINSNESIIDPSTIQAIFNNQQASQFLHDLKKLEIDPLRECCTKFICRLEKNVYAICVESKQYYSVWLEERQFRITGSVAYSIFTYRNNKNPDWKKKAINYFYPKSFHNCYIKHGLDNEIVAREAYEKTILPLKIVETGLIVSCENSWLGYSPDGIIFDENKPVKLIEIKCPYSGKKNKLSEVINSIKWLVKKATNLP
ncbi:uncharacterized protein LOC135162729 [Diachasmimorpha longicaudata]|uniref:uncharacterized protein LOC135162729 n=1 Tax=Diachasmimorpha longicaudata TaxID=58733 RepID=UPI0030B905FC